MKQQALQTLSCFEGFACIGGVCRDSCCIGWEIDIDEQSFERYQKIQGAFGERLRENIVTDEDGTHHYRLKGKRCPFLNEQGLCEQILTAGEQMLCEICDQHPRFYSELGVITEMGYGLACEQAARLLLASDQPLTLIHCCEADPKAEQDGVQWLIQARAKLIETAQDRTQSIYERLSALLMMAERLQEQLDWAEWNCLESLDVSEWVTEVTAGQGVQWLDWLQELQPIDQEWTQALQDTLSAAVNPECFLAFCEETEEQAWMYEHLLVYLLFRYGFRAAQDGRLAYWVQACVLGVLTVEQLAFGRWMHSMGTMTAQDWQDVFRIFSKEIEYDAEIMENLQPLEQCEPFV